MNGMILKVLRGIYHTLLFILGIIVLYVFSQILSILLTFAWERIFGYNPFLRESALAVPGAIIVSIASGIMVGGLFWRRSRSFALGALMVIAPLIFMYSFA